MGGGPLSYEDETVVAALFLCREVARCPVVLDWWSMMYSAGSSEITGGLLPPEVGAGGSVREGRGECLHKACSFWQLRALSSSWP